MLCCIHQPENLPWFNYFKKMKNSDVFILLDTVKVKKNYFDNRNIIITRNGPQYVTIPILHDTRDTFFGCKINKDDWKGGKKWFSTIHQTYSKSPFYSDLNMILEKWSNSRILERSTFLFDINFHIITSIAKLIIDKEVPKIFLASSLIDKSEEDLKSTDLLIKLIKEVRCNEYLMGKSGEVYNDMSKFSENRIRIVHDSVEMPHYENFNYSRAGNDPYPSIIDMIANIGLDGTRNLIKQF